MADTSLPRDSRLYRYRHIDNVVPLPNWGTLAQWKRRRTDIRRHLKLSAGLTEDTMRFRPKGRVVKRFRHEGIIVENIRIETLPGLFVMGNLYRPQSKKPVPVVLHPHGHSMNARTNVFDLFSTPHRGFNTALNGMAAFTWSMIAYEKDAMQIPHRAYLTGPEKEVCNLLGLSTFGLQLHNGTKVIDYLCGRKEIDARRVGCTGESGGATQTYYLAALDDRIKVTAPVVMLSGHFQGGCVCENAPNLHLEYSTLDYAGLIAPRPMFLTGCTGDWTHHMKDRELESMRALYRLYDREDALDGFYQDERHNYNRASREHVYAWMKRWLLDPSFTHRRVPESKLPVPESEQLLVHDTPVPPVKGAIRSTRSLIRMWSDFHQRAEPVEDMRALLDLDLPARSDLLVRNRTPRRASRGKRLKDNMVDYGRFSEDSRIKCRFVLPDGGKPTDLIVGNWAESKWERFVSHPPVGVQKRIDAGHGLIVPLLFAQSLPEDVRDYRETVESSYVFTSFNPTRHAVQASDIATTVRLAEVELGVRPTDLRIVAERGMALLSLIVWAALSDGKQVDGFAGDFTGIDFENPNHWNRQAYLPLVLRGGGLPSLARLAGRGKGVASGVSRHQRDLLPKGICARQKSMSLDELVSLE